MGWAFQVHLVIVLAFGHGRTLFALFRCAFGHCVVQMRGRGANQKDLYVLGPGEGEIPRGW